MKIVAFVDNNFNLLIIAFVAHQTLDYLLNFVGNGYSNLKKSSDYTMVLNGRYLILHITILLGVFGFQFLEKFEHINNKIPGLAYLIILFSLKSIGDYLNHKLRKSEKKALLSL
jgi:membrane protease YdiL (CAAX protease family)